MGSKQTKIEGSYLPDTPNLKRIYKREDQSNKQQPAALSIETEFEGENIDPSLDPRSPDVCRTPLNLEHSTDAAKKLERYQQQTPVNVHENPLSILKKRFFKGFTYNLNDPRSPQLNRTPMLFDEQIDKTLNLNDTFSDLFVETKDNEPAKTVQTDEISDDIMQVEEYASVVQFTTETFTVAPLAEETTVNDTSANNSSIEFAELLDEETMESTATLKQTPITLQQQFDPRSPTYGVERTPIMFTDDDDEAAENAMLESILATLSLDLSSASSVSFGTPNGKVSSQLAAESLPITKPANKPLDRVRTGKKRSCIPKRKPTTSAIRKQRIYEDRENSTPPSAYKVRTPIQKLHNDDSFVVRTPLGCVKNRTHLRSRSVETSVKSLKARLPLTSFDDGLNPAENARVTDLRVMQDSLEFL